MTYHGAVLLLSGYQADEAHIIKQYRAIVDKCVAVLLSRQGDLIYSVISVQSRYPTGALWILNRVSSIYDHSHPPQVIIPTGQNFAYVS
jgi:hypothetical protein